MIRLILATVAIALLLAIILWLVGERGHLLSSSTRRVIRQQGWQHFFKFQSWHFYVYGRWPKLYIGTLIHVVFGMLARLGRVGRQWLADRYHGKVLLPEHARSIITVEKEIPLRDLDQIVPYPTARHLLLHSPLDIVVYECPCRLARARRCEPTQVCMIVGQPFADLVLDHHPHTSRKLSKIEALELLEVEHQRGHVHVAWFKNACLDRFFAICNCCKCCCGGIDAMVHHGIPMMTSSGYVASSDADLCQGCGECEKACVFNAVRVNGVAAVDREKCMGCGVCVERCQTGAISVHLDPGRGAPLDVKNFVK
jgi:NAD-dependent dihydropyrimidine dehydrogenase PreA subunit